MKLFNRLKTGFSLVRRSVRVLADHPKLALFPLTAGVAGLGFLGVLWASLFAVGEVSSLATYAGLFAFYLASTFVSAFFTAGLMYCSRQAFGGETPRIGDGLRAASRNVGPLLIWSVVSATVGVLLRVLQDNDTPVARILAAMFSVAWTVMTYFVIPVVVFEDVGTVEMFSRSKETVTETWGESMGAVGGIGLVTVAFGVVGAVPGVALLVVGSGAVGLFGLLVLVAGVMLAALSAQTLTGIAKTALYVYATEDETPAYFDGIDFGDAEGSISARRPGSGGFV
ncbi:DUF6159 family protein [Halorussus halobius]|uniref:DUF6159 family protein n=1 Tax=Halorussus halobius TaxID=1710537 RepID=UPI0010928304|nr:DUF6159 family protein [Halorussus halobius]